MSRPNDTIDAQEVYAGISERDFQANIIDASIARGYELFHVLAKKNYASVTSFGFPDCVIGKAGRVIFAELKTRKAYRKNSWHNLTKQQRHWQLILESAGQEYYIWQPEHWDELIEILEKRTEEVD